MAHSILHNKSIFNPVVMDNKHIEVLKKLVLEDVRALKIKKKEEPAHIKKGIKTLLRRNDVIIRPADKGGGIVIQTKEDYHTAMSKLLDDEITYQKLSGNPVFD